MRRVLLIVGFVAGLYLVGRAVVELVMFDWSDPASTSKDWGGPTQAGVLAVHCGPGVISLALMIWWFVRRSRVRAAAR